MRKILILPALLIIVLLAGCTERITVTLDETYTRLVVYGTISDHHDKYRIDLTKTADYFYNQPVPRVTNATVSLNDGTNTFFLQETIPGTSGIYETDSTFHGIAGKTYHLDVELTAPIDNRTIYTSASALPSVTNLDSVRYEFNPDFGKKGVYILKVYAMEPPEEGNYYMFKWYRNSVLMTDSIQKIFVTDDKYFNGHYINGANAVYINQAHEWERVNPGDTLRVEMSGITKEYYDFINQVAMAGFSIPIFSGPPANITGNISDGAVGFFAAYASSYSSVVVK
jgi:hypothetical protein